MSMYGEDGNYPDNYYKKEGMYYEMLEFLDSHPMSDLISVMSDVCERVEAERDE
jgi:hypothetical protein